MTEQLDTKTKGPHLLMFSIIARAIAGTSRMIKEKEVPKGVLGYPRKLSGAELAALPEILERLEAVQQKLDKDPEKSDVSTAELFPEETVCVLSKKAGIESLFQLWQSDPKSLPGLFEYCRLLGGTTGKLQLHLYFFINNYGE